MKLSIIIPVYNVEQYVQRCILSIVKQKTPFSDYEIILVNDGSTDNSLNVINEVIPDYDHIQVATQENGGASTARNKGLSMAKGDYIWFVDSDDWIAEDCLDKIIPLLDNSLDCLTFKCNRYVDATDNEIESLYFEGIHSGMELMKEHKVSISMFTIYKSSLFKENNLSFHNGIYYEDSELIPKLYYFAKKCLFLDEVCYYYYQREGSAMTSSFSLQRALDLFFINENLLNFASETIKDKSDRSIFYYWIGLNINILVSRINQLNKDEHQRISSLLIKKRPMFHAMVKSRRLKHKMEGILFLCAPRLAFKLCELYFSTKNKSLCKQ